MGELRIAGVVGAGTMGHGIAQVCAMAGLQTRLFDVSLERAEQGLARITGNLDQGIARGKVTAEQKQATLERLGCTATLSTLEDSDVVIEAAPEELPLKLELIRKLSALCREDALIATNTSSLSLTELAAAAAHPERVIGLHFFNPAHVMRLVEIVRPLQASEQTVERARALVDRLGKQRVEVTDHPGFASSRLGIALGLEAIRMLEQGVGAAEDIDRAMELGYGHPMGPLRLTDLVGLDVRLAVAEYLYRELGSDTFRPPQLLKKLVRAGKLGRKSGEGFYRYPS